MIYETLVRQKTGKHQYCQDFYRVVKNKDSIIFLMADGHGGEPYVRSSLGARLAVYSAEKKLSEGTPSERAGEEIKELFDRLAEKHLKIKPLSQCEKKLLGKRPEIQAYGTTLLCVQLFKNGFRVFQLGDGNIHALDENARFMDILPKDDDCFLNVTSSLCQPKETVLKHFRYKEFCVSPSALLLYTDGYGTKGAYPWKAINAIINENTETELDRVLAEHKTKDDQTVILAYAPQITGTPHFSRSLEQTVSILKQEEEKESFKASLETEAAQLESYLAIAVPKAKKLEQQNSEEFERFIEVLTPRYERYIFIREKLNIL